MIIKLTGKIILNTGRFLVVENNGIGYKVFISAETNNKINNLLFEKNLESGAIGKSKDFSFWIHTRLREDCIDLYGFLDYKELEFFEMLLTVSGIGPKSAIAIHGITTIENFKKAINNEDLSYLIKVSGIGKKTAQKIILELKDKILIDKTDLSLKADLDTMEALKSMGYRTEDIRGVLKQIPPELDVNDKVCQALKILSSNK